MTRPLVIGHRGASGYRPEHTAAAYELAFAMGVDAVEPDIVASKDGVLVIRHENEISGTTDVSTHAEFAHRRTTKEIDGQRLTGWFTEDFTWAELSTLRAIERLSALRPGSAAFDGTFGMLRLSDLVDLMPDGLIMVAEIKHAAYFSSIGLPLDELFADAIAQWATPQNLIVESFEHTVLGQIAARAVRGRSVFLAEASGAPADRPDRPYASYLTDEGLARLAESVHGVSVDKAMLTSDLVARAHAAGLDVFTWTLRAENKFLPKPLRLGPNPAQLGNWREEFSRILATGVDGVFADQPDLVLGLLAE